MKEFDISDISRIDITPFLSVPFLRLVASSYGSLTYEMLFVLDLQDGRLMGKYEQYRSNLPVGTSEVVIDGGCHAGFGRYGAQDGDGTPAISSDEQINRTAEEIARMMGLLSQ